MDNIYDYLKADHDKVLDLFNQYDKAPSYEAKSDYINMIIKEWIIHAEAEQGTFYHTLEKHSVSQDEAFDCEKSHDEIMHKIDEILRMANPDTAWDNTVLELKKRIEQHIHQEQSDLFKKAKSVLSEQDAYVVREQMHDLKEKILTRIENYDELQHLEHLANSQD